MALSVMRKPAAKRSADSNFRKPTGAKRPVARVEAEYTTLKRPSAKRPAEQRCPATLATVKPLSAAVRANGLESAKCCPASEQSGTKRPRTSTPSNHGTMKQPATSHRPKHPVPSTNVLAQRPTNYISSAQQSWHNAAIILDQLDLRHLDHHNDDSLRAGRERSILIAAPLLALPATAAANHFFSHQRPPFRSFMHHNGFRCTITATRGPEACNWTELASDYILLYLAVQEDSDYTGAAKCHEDTVMYLRCLSKSWMTTFDRWISPCPAGPFFYNGVWTRTTGGHRTVEA
jgi:hypothetical protein